MPSRGVRRHGPLTPTLGPMDRAALAAELRRARFRTTHFREGYAERDVDDLIDRVARQLRSPDADPDADADVAAMVSAARLPTTKARRGYAQDDVDALLARLVRTLGGAWEARPTSAADGHPTTTSPSTAGTALPSAVTEPPRGLLSRLFGR